MSGILENNNNMNKASFSWWLGTHHHNTPHHSPWLQATLSDLDEKTKAMLSLIVLQEQGDSFAQRAEMYYKNKSELTKMVVEFHKSYRSLAERYDQLMKSESPARVNKLSNVSISDSNPGSSTVEDPDELPHESDTTKLDFEYVNKYEYKVNLAKPPAELNNSPENNVKIDNNHHGVIDKKTTDGFELDENDQDGELLGIGNLERSDAMWCDMKLQVSKLIEDNQEQQTELIRRNDEKREVIKDLCFQINKLNEENKTLSQTACFRCSSSRVGMKQKSHISKLKGLLLKFLGGGCPS